MQRLTAYLFRQLIVAFVFSAAAVTFVIVFTQSFRLLSLVIDNSATMLIFFQLMALSVPTFLPLVLPLSLGVAVIFVYYKLAVDSELVVMRAVGISPMRQAMPAIMLGGIVMSLCLILTLWLTPAAHRNLVALQYQVRENFGVFLSRPGYFNDITDGLTFYARDRGANGVLENILIHDVRNPDDVVTIMANTGQVMDNQGQAQIVVFDGRRQEMNVQTGKLSELAFDQYVLDLNALHSTLAPRTPDPREQSIWQLMHPDLAGIHTKGSAERRLSELNQRFASPLLALAFSLIALAAILFGDFNRRGMTRRILIAGLAIVAVQAVFMSLNGLANSRSGMAVMLYLAPILSALVGLSLVNSDLFRLPQLVKRPKP